MTPDNAQKFLKSNLERKIVGEKFLKVIVFSSIWILGSQEKMWVHSVGEPLGSLCDNVLY